MKRQTTLAGLGLTFGLGLAVPGSVDAQTPTVRRPPTAVLQNRVVRDTASTSPAPRTAGASVTTIDRARITRILGGPAANIRLSDATGVTDVPRNADSVAIAPGDFLWNKSSDSARVVMKSSVTMPGSSAIVARPAPAITNGATTYAIPYRWLTLDSAGVQRVLVPFFILRGGGLTYDVVRRVYKGTALVGVEDTLNPEASSAQLTRPLALMLATRSGGTVSPHSMNVSHTSLEYDSVSIESPDSTSVLLRTGADRVGITVPIPVRAIVASMIPDQRAIQGFGLATTEISVSLPRGLSRADTAVLTFVSTGAPVKPAILRLAGGDAGVLKLRSGMPGSDSIRAYLDGVPVAETVVGIKAPWPFLQATIIGVVLGGALRWSAQRRKSFRSLGWDIIRGMPFGAVAAAALSVGLTLLPVNVEDPSAWVGVMVTAALGAWVGSPLLRKAMPDAAP
jgi:hypothetical protein